MRVTTRRSEQGAIAVTVALLMVVLLGVAALAVDYGAYSVQKRHVQNAADARALAIAQECSKTPSSASCTTGSAGTSYIQANADARATGTAPDFSVPGNVTVAVNRPVEMTFARLGKLLSKSAGDPVASARARASWNNTPSVVGGETFLPIGINVCTFSAATNAGTSYPSASLTIQGGLVSGLLDTVQAKSCAQPGGGTATGQIDRYIWLTGLLGFLDALDVSVCNYRTGPLTTNFAVSTVNGLMGVPPGCTSRIVKLKIGDVLAMPIYKATGVEVSAFNTANLSVDFDAQIIGYAAFQVEGWKFGLLGPTKSNPAPCSGVLNLDYCIKGKFIRSTDNTAALAYKKKGGVNLDLGLANIKIEDLPQ
jgi:Flp pilus assembly protein TadG